MRLTEIRIHPIKSCRPISVTSASLDERGLVHDRRYMLVDPHGRFVTLRTMPTLSLVEVALVSDGFTVHGRDGEILRLPFEIDAGARREVVVWDDRVAAIEHDEGSRFFSRMFERELHLVHMPRDVVRAVNPKRARPGDRVSFADAYPLLLISEESVADLAARVGHPLSMDRFRPNLVFRGSSAYIEDRFVIVRIGGITFRGPKTCTRCVATTIDPRDGTKGVEPLRTLAKYRRRDGEVHFGMNLIHDGMGSLRVGDSVEPLVLGEPLDFD